MSQSISSLKRFGLVSGSEHDSSSGAEKLEHWHLIFPKRPHIFILELFCSNLAGYKPRVWTVVLHEN